ncbi:MAG: type II toxin-antitoxin system VapC family toxin [Thermomonas sp.]|uniref:type II toxin-antitoxin system VapC family toxin n=1 Tax=Thermomonas sp. TaxID=1971895 RepID=UPI0039E72B7E
MGLIYLDTNALIYAMESTGPLGQRARALLQANTSSDFAISPLVKLECLVMPIRTGDRILERKYDAWFPDFVQLSITEEAYARAADVRARFNLKTPDALHLACAQYHRCEALWTNDDRLQHASHGLAVNVFAGA